MMLACCDAVQAEKLPQRRMGSVNCHHLVALKVSVYGGYKIYGYTDITK